MMRRLVAILATSALLVGGLVVLGPQASAATWVYPSASFTVDDGFGATLAIDVQNLRVADSGGGGYARLAWDRYVCTQQFSGLTATWSSPSGSEPCSGTVTFAVDSSGALSAAANLLMTSRLFAGAATPTTPVQGTKWELTACTAKRAGSTGGAEISWTDSVPGATGYEITAAPALGQGVSAAGSPAAVSGLSPGTKYTFTVTATVSGAAPPPCSTNAVYTAPAAPVIDGTPVTVPVGGLMTVNYSLPDPTGVQGIEYQIDGGPWLRPGGVPPAPGTGGSFTVNGITTKDLTVTLRTVGDDAGGPLVTDGTATPVSFAKAPTTQPPAGTATGSSTAAPVPAPPPAPVTSVPGTSNGAGSGSNGALAASTGDAGIDAPCLAADGTLYPNQYSTMGSQLTMAPNTRGMGRATSFTVVGGALAPGMQLDRTAGVLFGVTTSPGSYVTTVKAAFANGSTKTSQFTTRVDADRQTLQYAAQNIGVVGRSSTISPTTNAPGVGTTYRLVCGVLPAGMRFNPGTGVITGRPTKPVALPTPLRVAETNPSGSAAASFIVVVNRAGASSFSYPAHPHVRAGKRAAIRPTVTGVKDVVTFRTSKGKLPKGLRINHRTGTITGRPAHAGRVHTVTIVAVTRGGALLAAPPMRIKVRR